MEGLGEALGINFVSKNGPEKGKLKFSLKLRILKDLGRLLGGSWEGLGRVLERFWEGLGAFWVL